MRISYRLSTSLQALIELKFIAFERSLGCARDDNIGLLVLRIEQLMRFAFNLILINHFKIAYICDHFYRKGRKGNAGDAVLEAVMPTYTCHGESGLWS